MQLEEYAKIKVVASPEGCNHILHELNKIFVVITTSPIIRHRDDSQAHFYATLIKKET